MEIKNWHVFENVNNKNDRFYYYGDVESKDVAEYEKDEYKEISYSNWISEDFAEILGNFLEDRNHHYLTSLGYTLEKTLDNIDNKLKNEIMKNFFENFIEQYL